MDSDSDRAETNDAAKAGTVAEDSNSSTDSNLLTAAVNADATAHEGAISTMTRRASDAASVRSTLSEAQPESHKEKVLLKKQKKKSKKSKKPEADVADDAAADGPEVEAEEALAPKEKKSKAGKKKRKSIDTPVADATRPGRGW